MKFKAFSICFVMMAFGMAYAADNYLQKGNNGSSLENANAFDKSGTIGINTGTFPDTNYKLDVNGDIICDGLRTESSGSYSPHVVGGHSSNSVCTISASCQGNTIGGGGSSSNYHTIGTGVDYGTIGGGYDNTVYNYADYSTVSGGAGNIINTSAIYSTVGGGYVNYIDPYNRYATISGGYSNNIDDTGSTLYGNTISGGYNNYAKGNYSTVGGGYGNTVDASTSATVSGGLSNTATGQYSTVPGGSSNEASGAYSWAGGSSATASHTGSFVWNDSSGSCSSTTSNEFNVCSNTMFFSTTELYISGGIDVDYVHYHSPYPENVGIAYDAVFSLQRLPYGTYDPNDTQNQLDHSNMHWFIKRENSKGEIVGELVATTMAQNEVIKDLAERNAQLEMRIAALEQLVTGR